MADYSVKVTAGGLGGRAVTSISMSYGINMVAECAVSVDPANPITDIDAIRRQAASVSVVAQDYNSKAGGISKKKTLSFNGRIDGLSTSSQVGGSSCTVILKGLAQGLLETNTKVPGLSSLGMNPFTRIPSFGKDASKGGDAALKSVIVASNPVLTSNKIIPVFYIDILKACLNLQLSPGSLYSFMNTTTDREVVNRIYSNPSYRANIITTLDFLNGGKLDISGISSMLSDVTAANQTAGHTLTQSFLSYPDIVWSNLQAFFSDLGCLMVSSNSKVFVVPQNGFISPSGTTTNVAKAEDVISLQFNDNGDSDVGGVAVVTDPQSSNFDLAAGITFLGCYPSTGGAAAGGASGGGGTIGKMVIVPRHPFMFINSSALNNPSLFRDKTAALSGSQGHYTTKIKASDILLQASGESQAIQESSKVLSPAAMNMFNNFAQAKYYQYKYQDRGGSISFGSLQPNWVPGTTGQYIDKDGNKLLFFVTNVTHNINISGNSGSAVTTVSFNCGRWGGSGISDSFFNYNAGKMGSIQSAFLADLGV